MFLVLLLLLLRLFSLRRFLHVHLRDVFSRLVPCVAYDIPLGNTPLPWSRTSGGNRKKCSGRRAHVHHNACVERRTSRMHTQTEERARRVRSLDDLFILSRSQKRLLCCANHSIASIAPLPIYRECGMPRFQLVELLRGSGSAAAAEAAAASSIVRRSSTCSDRNNSKDNGCADGEGSGGILQGIESGSAVQGPRCSVCDQYCFLTTVVCHTCDGGAVGRASVRTSSNGSPGNGGSGGGEGGTSAAARRRHARKRFACGRHLADLCQCPASEYTYYQRRDAAQLRAAAEGLTSSEEQTEAWVEEAKNVLDAAKGTGGGMVNSIRSAKAKISGGRGSGGDATGSGAASAENGAAPNGKVTLAANPKDEIDAAASGSGSAPQQQCSSSSAGAPANTTDGDPQEEDGADVDIDEMELQLDVPTEEDEEAPMSSLLPTGWRERPSLRFIADLIRVGEELAVPPGQTLDSLRDVVNACAGWVKTIEGILGANDSDRVGATNTTAAAISLFGTAKRAAATTHVADDNGGGGGAAGGGGGRGRGGRGLGVRDGEGGRSGTRSENSTGKRREQVPFHKATKLLSTEANLPGRPVETTERLCVAILAACRLRLQVRLLLGLGEDEVCDEWSVGRVGAGVCRFFAVVIAVVAVGIRMSEFFFFCHDAVECVFDCFLAWPIFFFFFRRIWLDVSSAYPFSTERCEASHS